MAEVLSSQPPKMVDLDGTIDEATIVPLANPPFMFPSQPNTNIESRPHSPVSQVDAARPDRARARSKPERLSLNALPAFDFSPAASSSTNTPSDVPRSPTKRTPPAYASTGHRRNGSEYVGGDIMHGGPMLVSTSPKKISNELHSNTGDTAGSFQVMGNSRSFDTSLIGEAATYSAPNARLGPPTSRRGHGHAHRRSGAISSHDISMILKPAEEGKAGSAPTTPSDPIFQIKSPPELDRSASQPILATVNQSSSDIPISQDVGDAGEESRPRTRFSERLEYIPRPLSTISSETSSSMSTIRASHSVADSISSVVSGAPASPTTSRPSSNYLYAADQGSIELDPKTTGQNSSGSSRIWRVDDMPTEPMIKRPSTAASGEINHQADEHLNGGTLQDAVTFDRSYGDLPSGSSFSRAQVASNKNIGSYDSKRRFTPSTDSPAVRPRTSPELQTTRRQGKGKSWSGLLSRKGKDQDLVNGLVDQHPLPSENRTTPTAELSLENINLDEDTTCIIETGSPYYSGLSGSTTDYNQGKPSEPGSPSGYGPSAPILDIDAALGSIEDTSLGPSFEEVAGGASTAAPRRMHSSGITGGFTGPGMHYHRRTESAPEMEAPDRSRFGFQRLGSNPAMAIEEEEEGEDEEEAIAAQAKTPSRTDQANARKDFAPGLGVNIVEAEKVNNQPLQRLRRRPMQSHVADDRTYIGRMRSEEHDDFDQVEIVQADEEPRFSVVTKSSDESTITPTLSRDPLDIKPISTTSEFHMPTSADQYGTSDSSSAGPSPDFIRTSFDTPRMHTATSSITDRSTLNSSRAGDHSLGLHSSVDDVPSLTSSASTMSAHPPRFSISVNSTADRSASLSAAATPRPRPQSSSAHKRLSLASLSRLAGGSYNRSKLNIEESAPDDTVERAEKKKGNRLSRMMKKFRTKDKLSST